MKRLRNDTASVKIYHGYGHKENLIVFGHVLARKQPSRKKYKNNPVMNIAHLARLFFVRPIAGVRVLLQWEDQLLYTTTASDGFFKFEWKSEKALEPGWHLVNVHLVNEANESVVTGEGKVYVPHSTQYGFISDIDDTVLVSHSSTTGKKLRVLFTKNPRSRKTFSDVVHFYQLLALTHTVPSLLNPFFYVSSSEWNLYEDLNEFFKHNNLPKGIFLLSPLKKWNQLLKTGATKHQGKMMRIVRILEAFPKQRFILLGDNTQSDPEIYAAIANKYPDRIVAVYIRNINRKKEAATQELISSINNSAISTCFFKHTSEAIEYSRAIGLLS